MHQSGNVAGFAERACEASSPVKKTPAIKTPLACCRSSQTSALHPSLHLFQPPPLSKAAAAAAYYAAADDAGIDDPPPPPTSSFAPLTISPPFDPTAGLEPWQAGILAAAYLKGKRKVSIQEVAAAADVDRAGVLAWFKAVDGLLAATVGAAEGDEGRAAAKASALAALVAAGEADTAVAGRATEVAATRAAAAEAAALAEGRAWSPTPADRRFSAAALATLERVFEEVREGKEGERENRTDGEQGH